MDTLGVRQCPDVYIVEDNRQNASHSNKAHETVADRHSKSAERKLTNPLLLRRYARLQEQAGAARETTNRRQPPLLAAFRE